MLQRGSNSRQELLEISSNPPPDIKPADFGIPSQFRTWRASQWAAIEKLIHEPKRFAVPCAPTGFGKSLVYMAYAQITGARVCVLTSTKGLQQQLMGDFEEMGLTNIQGMNNYECLMKDGYHGHTVRMCDKGPCRVNVQCGLKHDGCLYFDAKRTARSSHLVVTNYDYWLKAGPHKGSDGLGDFDVLILDEAHDAPGKLAEHLRITLLTSEVEDVLMGSLLGEDAQITDWQDWAEEWEIIATQKFERLNSSIAAGNTITRKATEDMLKCGRLIEKLKKVQETRDGAWVCEGDKYARGSVVNFDPVWPGKYSEQELFQGIKKVILVSATVRPKTLEILGVPDTKYSFYEWPSTFPVKRRPITWIPTMNVRRGADLEPWVRKIDELVGARKDRKGIVHTVSYDRARIYLENSRFTGIHTSHRTADIRREVENFKRSDRPGVMVSPSLGTGWDFPHDECRYQIIAKVPFPDSGSKVMKARELVDKEYPFYLAAQGLVQACGRGMRAENDWCETFIIDDNISWFISRWGKFIPKWWLQAYSKSYTNPEPLGGL